MIKMHIWFILWNFKDEINIKEINMKIQIRNSVLESNSSSTHAICISKYHKNTLTLPKCVTFRHGDFGWTFDVLTDTEDKAAYLYQAIFDLNYSDKIIINKYKNKLYDVLWRYGVDCIFPSEKDDYDEHGWVNGYIDHPGELREFVDRIFNNESMLLNYLFGDSFIVTGNDNGDSYHSYLYGDSSWCEPRILPKFKDYDIYEKGN